MSLPQQHYSTANETALGSTCFNRANHTAFSTTRPMEQDTPLLWNNCLASQEIPNLLQNARFHYCVHRRQPLDFSLSQTCCGPNSPVLLLENSFCYSSTCTSVFQIIYRVLVSQLTFCMHFLSTCSLRLILHWSIKIFGGIKNMKLLIRNFSPFS
jgi:hypothetical protein